MSTIFETNKTVNVCASVIRPLTQSKGQKNAEVLFATVGTGLAIHILHRYFKQLIDKKVNELYYQPEFVWTSSKAIRELHKITSTPKKYISSWLAKTSALASLYTFTSRKKSPSLRSDKIISNISLICFMCPIISLKRTYASTC